MGRQKSAGLVKRNGIWYINKRFFGSRIRQSTGTSQLAEAEVFLARKVEEARQALIYGVRPKRLFCDAATKYLIENTHKASLRDDAGRLKKLDKFIGDLSLEQIHIGALQAFINARKAEGVKMRTINHGLKIVRRILNLAATEWMDENGLMWLHSAVKIKLLPEPDLRKPYPLNWEEKAKLFKALPLYLRRMALFAVNTGCRDAEICSLKWQWEVQVPEPNNRSVFIVPAEYVKNREDPLVVLNDVAWQVVEAIRGQHSEFVFTYNGKPLQ